MHSAAIKINATIISLGGGTKCLVKLAVSQSRLLTSMGDEMMGITILGGLGRNANPRYSVLGGLGSRLRENNQPAL